MGIILDEHYELHSHVDEILNDGYSTLQILELLKLYVPYYLRKQLCESSVLSKVDYCNILFKTLPQYQKIDWRNFCNSVQVSLNANTDVKMTLYILNGYYQKNELIDSSILKLVYNGINKENMPANLKLELKKPTRASRNNSPIIIAKDKNMNKSTFIEEANEIGKELPSNTKQEVELQFQK